MTNYLFWGPLAALISGLLYLLLKLTLEKTITTRIDYIKEKEIENLKASFTKELESARHQYQLQQVRTPLFFDHQRHAFSEILSVLVDITDAFARSYDPSTDEHNPIPGKAHEKEMGSSLRLTHEQSIFSYFNIFSDFLSLFLNFYAPLNLD